MVHLCECGAVVSCELGHRQRQLVAAVRRVRKLPPLGAVLARHLHTRSSRIGRQASEYAGRGAHRDQTRELSTTEKCEICAVGPMVFRSGPSWLRHASLTVASRARVLASFCSTVSRVLASSAVAASIMPAPAAARLRIAATVFGSGKERGAQTTRAAFTSTLELLITALTRSVSQHTSTRGGTCRRQALQRIGDTKARYTWGMELTGQQLDLRERCRAHRYYTYYKLYLGKHPPPHTHTPASRAGIKRSGPLASHFR